MCLMTNANFACENLRPASPFAVFLKEKGRSQLICTIMRRRCSSRSPYIDVDRQISHVMRHTLGTASASIIPKDERIPTFGQANNRYLPTMSGFLLRFTGAGIIVSMPNATSAVVDDGAVKGSPCCSAIYVTSPTLIFSYSPSLLDSVVFSEEILSACYWQFVSRKIVASGHHYIKLNSLSLNICSILLFPFLSFFWTFSNKNIWTLHI